MDRSLLSHKPVIDASRSIICIRLATYENKEETQYLEKVFRGRAGTLENTVFAMLSPKADRYLARPGRSPEWTFSSPEDMARGLKEIAARYPPTGEQEALPAMENLRLALDVAACDSMPLIVATSADAAKRVELNKLLARLAWNSRLRGKYAYSPAATPAELRAVKLPETEGIVLVMPHTYGLTGLVTQRWPLSTDAATLVATLERLRPTLAFTGKVPRTHMDGGWRGGFSWQTLMPVTDPG
ncbi:MAG: hypothetical protein QM758_01540 [Armatimonas sp.]